MYKQKSAWNKCTHPRAVSEKNEIASEKRLWGVK
jgi:hypothetical protein